MPTGGNGPLPRLVLIPPQLDMLQIHQRTVLWTAVHGVESVGDAVCRYLAAMSLVSALPTSRAERDIARTEPDRLAHQSSYAVKNNSHIQKCLAASCTPPYTLQSH